MSYIKSLLFISLFSFTANAAVSEAEFRELQAKVEELEFDSFTRNYSISGEVINLFESYHNDQTSGSSVDATNMELFGTIAKLNINVDVNDRIKFYSSLGMSKFWNNEDRIGDAEDNWNRSNQGSLGYQGSVARFDKVYFDYLYNDMFTFSIGRMPTNFGPPYHQLDNEPRSGTYPRMAYNSIFDGVALSTNLTKFMPENQELKIKLFYTPYMNVDQKARNKPRNIGELPGTASDTNTKVQSNTLLWAFLLEYGINNLSWVEKIQTYLFTLNYEDFWWQTYGDTYRGWGYNATIGFEGLFNTGLNFWASYIGTDWQASDKKHINGAGYLINLNYSFENGHSFGGEYLKTNKYYYLDEWTYYNVADFYKVGKLKGYHLFWSMPVYKNLRLRLGSYIYDTGADSAYGLVEREVESYYAMLKLTF